MASAKVTLAVIVKMEAEPEPIAVELANMLTVEPDSASPVMSGVVLFVILSVLEPEFVKSVISSPVGAAGAVVSIVIISGAEELPVPSALVAFAVMLWTP